MNTAEKLNMTMLCDFYELTMGNGYFRNGYKDRITYFDVFFRKVPDEGGYAIAAGLEQLIDYIENLHFSEEDIAYLRGRNLFCEEFLDYLRHFRFTGDIYAIPEGTPVFPREPMVVVRAPSIEAQLIETFTLLTINHQSLIATKAARVCYAAKGDGIMEFGLRRAQGPDAGIYGARAAMIAGCVGTSNVLTGQMFDVPVMGTHAHSWIMSFPSELEAFRTYAELFPDNCLLLVDTYDTLNSGVKHAIQVFREMREKGIHSKLFGIRLDSGDLAYLTKKARIMLDEAGFPDAIISASSDLDEYLINSLMNQGAKITSWGVGTNLITSKDCPSFGGVYKLACIIDENGTEIPKIKVSENVEKVTNPGNKKILRIYDKASGKIKADLITLEDEVFTEDQPLTLFDPLATWKRTRLEAGTYTIRELLVPIFKNGQCVYESPSVMDIQAYCTQEKATLWDESKRLINPQEVYVDLSRKLYDLKNQLLDDAHTIKD